MDRLLTRRGVMIGAGSVAAAALMPSTEISADSAEIPTAAPVAPLMRNRVALTAFGELELPTVFLGNDRAVARSRDINCRLYLSSTGEMFVDSLNYSDKGTIVQLSQEQHEQLLAAFTGYASPTVFEEEYLEPVQPKGAQS